MSTTELGEICMESHDHLADRVIAYHYLTFTFYSNVASVYL